jgi:cardiolipin synthase (CMP-forming)
VTTSSAPATTRRKITANQVTIARILALPFPCWALFARPADPIMWTAFFFGLVVGGTDFVDGWMARRDGPTRLGALLDPVADKLFMAMLLIPCVAHAECPGWAAASLFARELLITSLRSSLAVRSAPMKTSDLGKLKTVVQMGGIAVFFLTIFTPMAVMPWVHLGCATAFFLGAVVVAVRRGGWPPLWLTATPMLLFVVFAMAMWLPVPAVSFWVFMLMVLFTWVSGADYLGGAWRTFRSGGVRKEDALRVVWSLVHGFSLLSLIDDLPFLGVPVMISLCAELSLGGIENLVSATERRFARGTLVLTLLLSLAIGIAARVSPSSAWLETGAWVLAFGSVANLLVAAWLERKVMVGHM